MNIVFIGPAGSGKGTQSEILSKEYNLVHITTGGLFRDIIKNKGEYAETISSLIDKGNLVPDNITKEVMSAEIKKYPDATGFIFDGFPRTLAQYNILQELLIENNLEYPKVIELILPDEDIKERLKKRAIKEQRADDADPAFVQKRLDIYKNETISILNLFDTYYTVDSSQSVDNTTKQIKKLLNI